MKLQVGSKSTVPMRCIYDTGPEYDQNEYDICLGISSERKYCRGLKVEATVELAHA